MKIIEPIHESRLPFKWLNLDYLPNSNCIRKEIYLNEDINVSENLAILFYSLFGNLKDKLIVSNGFWGDFCLDSWNPNTNGSNYSLKNKSTETLSYLKALKDSEIEYNYDGNCKCLNWDKFLSIILPCIINHKAPFSPLIYCVEEEFVFYFHHTGSIGFLYKHNNNVVNEVLAMAKENNYIIKEE